MTVQIRIYERFRTTAICWWRCQREIRENITVRFRLTSPSLLPKNILDIGIKCRIYVTENIQIRICNFSVTIRFRREIRYCCRSCIWHRHNRVFCIFRILIRNKASFLKHVLLEYELRHYSNPFRESHVTSHPAHSDSMGSRARSTTSKSIWLSSHLANPKQSNGIRVSSSSIIPRSRRTFAETQIEKQEKAASQKPAGPCHRPGPLLEPQTLCCGLSCPSLNHCGLISGSGGQSPVNSPSSHCCPTIGNRHLFVRRSYDNHHCSGTAYSSAAHLEVWVVRAKLQLGAQGWKTRRSRCVPGTRVKKIFFGSCFWRKSNFFLGKLFWLHFVRASRKLISSWTKHRWQWLQRYFSIHIFVIIARDM